ncbi:ABC transporter permease [Leucobacter soli]|uniref:Aliphatic sulfonates transport permease protein SsuC n=2 Tax=Leucobacter soli TaxID=2812850 RepID=A0A916JWG7_9MICO|nr:ABC transporter permease [Leucobacter soli]CAG7610191.1 Putative aliphatic sulfonates transport permease protein SsuC [Leucobacter soli]
MTSTTRLYSIPKTAVSVPRLSRRALLTIEVLAPILLLAAWWVFSANSTNVFFPPLSRILQRFRELWLFDHFMSDVVPSLANLALGFAIAAVAGVILGMLMGTFKRLRWMLSPIMDFFRSIPTVALVPIFISLFGFGNETRVVSIAVASVFPIAIATMDGVRGLDQVRRDVATVFKLTTFERMLRVNLPGASPMLFSGLQVGLMYAFIVMIASEMLGISVGIGAITLESQQTFRMADMWAGILLLGVIGYLINLLFLLVRRRALRWYFASQRVKRAG